MGQLLRQLTGNGNWLEGITATRTVEEADIDADAAIFGVIRINSVRSRISKSKLPSPQTATGSAA